MAPRAAIRVDDRHGAPLPVECARCGATVEIVKYSPQHTSAQWTAAAVRQCAEFRLRAAEGTRSALVDGCASLRDSIDAAVASGLLAVAPPSYEPAAAHEPVSPYEAGPACARPRCEQPDSARLLSGARGGGHPRDG